METTKSLAKVRKDALIEMVQELSRGVKDGQERLIAAAVLGGFIGFVIGLGW